MRFTRLLFVVLLVLLVNRTAASQDQEPNGKPETAAPHSDYVRSWADNNSHFALRAQAPISIDNTELNDNLCYALQAFIMARESKDSDATRLVAHRTCTPARRFQMKAAMINPAAQQ